VNWAIVETDLAEQDREVALLFVLRLRGLEYAERWHNGLLEATASLAEFPGPRAHPRVESEEERRRAECRVLLYTGPDRRPAPSVSYRVLYTVLNPVQGEESGTLFLQRIRHALRSEEEASQP
jgi:plasmid stabilization system protein ParE